MKKIDKKSLIIILILLINIGLITIPYNIKNINLEKQHKNMTKKAENTKAKTFFCVVLTPRDLAATSSSLTAINKNPGKDRASLKTKNTLKTAVEYTQERSVSLGIPGRPRAPPTISKLSKITRTISLSPKVTIAK